MPYCLELDQEALDAIHDARTWSYALADTILGTYRVQPEWSAATHCAASATCPMISYARSAMSPRGAADTTPPPQRDGPCYLVGSSALCIPKKRIHDIRDNVWRTSFASIADRNMSAQRARGHVQWCVFCERYKQTKVAASIFS